MESESLAGDLMSPESTVTSLLSSSGHLRSSLRPPELSDAFRYRDKEYDSASAALDAYIEDFERSRHNFGSLTGTLVLPRDQTPAWSKERAHALRNKDVLREHLTDWELDFLNLPVSSLRHHGNRDRQSMTTDELLSIPRDGSMPVTHTSAFIQGLLSQYPASIPCPSSSRPEPRPCAGLSSTPATLSHLNQHHHYPQPTRTHRCGRRLKMTTPTAVKTSFADRAGSSEVAQPSSLLHLPHWFTSNKAHMDCSEINSVPELSYPAWIQHCDFSDEAPGPVPGRWENNGIDPPGPPRTRAPSWVSDLEKDEDPNHAPEQLDSHQTLRDLRLQLAEQISLLAVAGKGSDVLKTLHRDNRIECLIQKADAVLSSLSRSCRRAESPSHPGSSCLLSPANTEDICPQPRHLPFAQSSAAGGSAEALTDGEVEIEGSGPHDDGIRKQPGPVEALKQMMFRLQSVEAELQRRKEEPVAPALTSSLQTPVKPLLPGGEKQLQGFSGRPSLQRALRHLSRLKLLVEEPRRKSREDEDEGRFSSSSADGLASSQHDA